MIAMQYNFVLPADYDMDIIAQRIAAKGHMTDRFPGLRFKAYLSARKQALVRGSVNLYAPFYVWENTEGMNDFLCGPGFEGVSDSFGRPSVSLWSVLGLRLSDELSNAVCATRDVVTLRPDTDLAELRRMEQQGVHEDVEDHRALGSVVAFEPTTWSLVRFRLWSRPQDAPASAQTYAIGHMSVPLSG
jgi:Domain of unknown function (DUF4865)